MVAETDTADRFEAAYRAGVTHEQPPPATAALSTEALPSLALAEAIALRGAVLAPEAAIDDGYVVIEGGEIKAVRRTRPEGVRVHETEGVIAPGLIDLHGHPEFNIFAAWEPPKQFINRYAWRGSDLYRLLVRARKTISSTSSRRGRSFATRRSVPWWAG
jgi:5-methylthioadenosine/S-adenosylhomocysteine deaminase